MRNREYFGHELDVISLLDKKVEIFDFSVDDWKPYNRMSTYRIGGTGETIFVRTEGVTEMESFDSMLCHQILSSQT